MGPLLATARTWGIRPSSLLTDLSGLEAYLFDEAAALWLQYLENGKRPVEEAGEEIL